MSIVIQTWIKSKISWSVQISSLNHLLNLVQFQHAIQEELITLIDNENTSRTITNVNEDEIEKEISSDIESEESENLKIESENSVSLVTEKYLMTDALIQNISESNTNINTTLILVKQDIMTNSEEWTNTKKKEIKLSEILSQFSLETHVIDLENNALLITLANDTLSKIVMKNSLIQNILNVVDQELNEDS